MGKGIGKDLGQPKAEWNPTDDGKQRLSTIGEICCHHLLLATIFYSSFLIAINSKFSFPI